MRHIIFDTETTGREPRDGDRIVEIGCVELWNLVPTGRTFHCYLNPGSKEIPDEVVRVHGLTNAFLRDKPNFGDATILEPLLAFFGDDLLVAHNAEFDRKFLNAELERIGRPGFPSDRFVDTLAIAREKFPGANNKLDALAKRFGLDALGFDLEGRKGAGGHGALLDAKMLAEVFLGLNGGRQRRLDIGLAADAEEQAQTGRGAVFVHPPRAPRPAALGARRTAEEDAAHATFLAGFPAPALWAKFLDS